MSKKKNKGGARAKARASDEEIAAAVYACRDEHGNIPKAAVVAAARDPDNILHKEFEWDKDKLVQKALEARAAELIRQCRSIINLGERELIFPTYLSAPRGDGSVYTPTLSIAKNEGQKKLALEAEMARIKAAIRRAAALSMIFGLRHRFDAMLAEAVEIEISLAEAAE